MPRTSARTHLLPLALAVTAACAPKGDASTGGESEGTSNGPAESTGEPTTGHLELDCERPVDWSVRFGGPTSDTLQGLAVDPVGNIYVGLDLHNLGEGAPVHFGDFKIVPGELSELVLVKLTTDGEVVWVRHFGGPGDQYLEKLSLCGDGIVIKGRAEPGSLDLGGGPLAEGEFLGSLDGMGKHRWSRSVPTGDPDAYVLVADMACDAAENLVMTGSHRGSVDLGGGPLIPADLFDGFVARFNSTGEHVWSRDFGDRESRGVGITYTPTGNIALVISFDGTLDLGGGPASAAQGDVLLSRLDADGNHVWSTALGPSGLAAAVAVDSKGQVAVGGIFPDTMKLGAETYMNAFPDADEAIYGTLYDGFLALTDPNGSLQWSLHLDSKFEDDVYWLAFDAHDVLMTSGIAEKMFMLRAFAGPKLIWSWCTPELFQVEAALSPDDTVIVAPSNVVGEIDLGAGLLPGYGQSDVVIAKVRR